MFGVDDSVRPLCALKRDATVVNSDGYAETRSYRYEAITMKTRSRTLSSTLLSGTKRVDQFSYPSGSFIETSTATTGATPYTSRVETIQGEEPKRKGIGYCKHTCTTTNFFEVDLPVSYVEGRKYLITYGGGYIVREILWPRTTLVTGVLLVDLVDWSALSFQAMQAMSPDLSNGLQLGAFIGELPKPGPNMRQKWRRIWAEFRQDGWRAFLMHRYHQIVNNPNLLLRRSAELNLFYQFGLKPFADDCILIHRNLRDLEAKITALLSQAGKPVTKHYSRALDIIKLPHKGLLEVYHDGDYKNQLLQKYEWVSRPIYHATVTYIIDVDELKGLLGDIRGFISAMGLDKILGTIWELIPFSFAVDWFVDVSGFLEALDRKLFGALPILILEYCHSVKYEYQTTITWQSWVTQSIVGSVPTIFGQATLAQQRVKYYERKKDTPCLLDLQSSSGLTVRRVSLAGSIAYSKYARRRA